MDGAMRDGIAERWSTTVLVVERLSVASYEFVNSRLSICSRNTHE